jgi:hypothetical protein
MVTQQFLKLLPIAASLLCFAMLHCITAMMKVNWALVHYTLCLHLSHQRKLRGLSMSQYDAHSSDEKFDVNPFSVEKDLQKAVMTIHEAN